MLAKLFTYLSLDQVTSCRQVNKRWAEVGALVRQKKLTHYSLLFSAFGMSFNMFTDTLFRHFLFNDYIFSTLRSKRN